MSQSVFYRRLPGLAVALCAIYAGPLDAQEFIDEIVVTADYRGRLASELPSSISVLDAGGISEMAVQHFEELIDKVPNLNWSGDGNRARYLQIRGAGELAEYQGAPNPSVGFIVDDIDFSGIGSIATLFDMQRIEILRGPQGTRYGANALAGLVYLYSAEPGDTPGGKASLTVAGDDAWSAGVALGGPLGAQSGYRVSAHQHESNGFRDNAFLGRENTNGRDELTLRGRLVWEAGDAWSFNLTGMLVDIDDGYDAFAIDNSLTVLSDKPGKDAQRSVGASLRAEWQAPLAFELTSITSLADSDMRFSFDADWGNDDAWAPVLYDYFSYNDRQRRTLSQEVRLTSTDAGRVFAGRAAWLAGMYVNRMDEDLLSINEGEYFDPGFNFADSLDERLASDFSATTTALFGQIDVSVGDAGTFSAGARVERRTVDYRDTSGLDVSPAENMLGGQLSYTHALADRVNAYASISRGYKAGGFNLGFVPEGRRTFAAEAMWNFELGVKSVLADGLMTLNGAVFYSRREDQQVETSFQINPNDPASFVFYTDNAASGVTTGLEAELQWFPTDVLELYLNVGLLAAEFDRFVTPQLDISGRDQAHAPAYTLAFGGAFRHPTGFFARVDVAAKDEFYFDVSHDQKSSSYSVTNLRLGYEVDEWSLQLWARNLLDEHYAVRGFFFGNEPPDFPATLYIRQGDPRQLGITFEKRF